MRELKPGGILRRMIRVLSSKRRLGATHSNRTLLLRASRPQLETVQTSRESRLLQRAISQRLECCAGIHEVRVLATRATERRDRLLRAWFGSLGRPLRVGARPVCCRSLVWSRLLLKLSHLQQSLTLQSTKYFLWNPRIMQLGPQFKAENVLSALWVLVT